MEAREFVLANKIPPPTRPTLAELEELLNKPAPDTAVFIAPDGSVSADVPQWLIDYMERFAASEVKRVAPDGLIDWLRKEADERVKSAKGRRESAACMAGASDSEVRAAHKMAERMSGHKLPFASKTAAEQEAYNSMQNSVAAKQEKEAAQLSAWATALATAREEIGSRRTGMAVKVSLTVRPKNYSDAAICRENGWTVGTRLAGDEGYGITVIELTAIGESHILAKEISHKGVASDCREGHWTLMCRKWSKVQ